MVGVSKSLTRAADQITTPGPITAQIIRQLLDAPLVIADLSGTNPNVMYELAIRHSSGKPVIQISTNISEIPFDVAGLRTIGVDIVIWTLSRMLKGFLSKRLSV